MTRILCLCFCACCAGLFSTSAPAQTPEWIWHPDAGQAATNGEVRWFKKTFTVDGKINRGVLSAAVDDRAGISVNGSPAIKVNGYERATRNDVTEFLRSGENELTVWATNESSLAGVLVRLELSLPARRRETIVSDSSWLSSVAVPTNWVKAVSLGKVGKEPWGDPLKSAHATSAESLTVLPGFKVELIRTAEAEEGSWISMAIDNKGRLIISPQDDKQPLLRVTLTRAGQVARVDPIPAKLRQAMGTC